jgi:hypothetical protein
MRRLATVLLTSSFLTPALLQAQSSWDGATPIQFIQPPMNYFSAGIRYSGRITASFSNLGTIDSARDIGDTTSEYGRVYDDGYVGLDSRTTQSGEDVYDDGRTNNWSYSYASQVTADQGSIAFHTYSSKTQGGGIAADSGANLGIDMEYARRLGSFGRRPMGQEPAFTFGLLAGVGLNGVNAKTNGTVTATLHTVTDVYSLLGATPPEPGYVAPSSTSETITNPDGTTTTVNVDTTTYLANRPDTRTESDVLDAAQVEGFWQVRGAYYNFRAGPWFRWQPSRKLALRASAGGSMTWLGVTMRYDEKLAIAGFEATDAISAKDVSESESFAIPGAFGSLDLEWWISRRTALFGSFSYEYFSRSANLSLGERSAHVRVESGLTFRVGITTRF